jgi:hypothetical protein
MLSLRSWILGCVSRSSNINSRSSSNNHHYRLLGKQSKTVRGDQPAYSIHSRYLTSLPFWSMVKPSDLLQHQYLMISAGHRSTATNERD